ncbi:MAG: hypothetical protein PF440_11725 [Thiomicrorhabdus sp.]|jgi:hypothetical protein|nr:hypothetical protein [Thiomicrorhabdus sp.]
MKIPITHNNIDWILFVDDYDAEEGQAATWGDSGGEPGYPDSVMLNDYHLQLDSANWDDELREKINAQLRESDKLHKYIYALYEDDILHKALNQFLKDNDENFNDI